jgi:hypothetical protein
MRLHYLSPWLVIDWCLQILNERTVAPDIHGLGSGTDAKDRLVQVKGVLQEQLIHGGAARIRLTALGDRIFAISLWVYVKAATGEQYPLDASQNLGHAVLALVEGHNNRRCPGGVKRGKILLQRPLIVGVVAAGGFGNGDANGHGSTSVITWLKNLKANLEQGCISVQIFRMPNP